MFNINAEFFLNKSVNDFVAVSSAFLHRFSCFRSRHRRAQMWRVHRMAFITFGQKIRSRNFLKIYKNGKNCGLLNATFISKKLIQFSIKEEKEQTSLSNFAASNNSWNCAVFTAGLWN